MRAADADVWSLPMDASSRLTQFRFQLGLAVGVTASVWACVLYLDRPFAQAFSRYLYGSQLQTLLSAVLSPFPYLVVIAVLCLALAGGFRAFGGVVPGWARPPLLASLSLICALISVLLLKSVFGRSALDPWYVQHGIYMFRWFDSGWAYDSFPSGTLTVATALLYTLSRQHPHLRALCMLSLLVVLSGLLATGSHWLSDALAGIYLGFLMATLASRLYPLVIGAAETSAV